MKYPSIVIASALIALFTVRCGGSNPTEDAVETPDEINKNETFDERAQREIEAKLKINGTEHYTYRIYRAHINEDTIQDAIITVNRKEFAMDEAIQKGKTAKAEELGYLGNYNIFFYYDGALDVISDPVAVPSSPGRELDVTMQQITSTSKTDIIIDYRIRNSGWRSYFTASGEGTLSLMFQWKWFDHVGEDVPEALNQVLEPNPNGGALDISIYESSIDGYTKEVGDVYKYVPEITKKGALQYRFFFDPRVGKYRLYSDPMLKKMGLTAVGPKK